MQKVGSVTETADSNGEFTNGNVAQGVPPTILLAEIFNTWQRELVNIVEGSGMELDPNDFGQLLKAINRSVGSGRLLNIKTFSSNGTYTPTQGTKKILVKVWGGGGGGGNTDVAGAGGPSGSGGGYAEGLFDVPTAPVSVIVGSGGAAVPANTAANGGNGGPSSFGVLINCGGGTGGTLSAVIPGGVASGGNVINATGQGGQGGITELGGSGGGAFCSFGGLPHNSSNGDAGGFPGGGGAGGTKASSSKYYASGAGANGYVIVMEYA